jgi:hypothetical protein
VQTYVNKRQVQQTVKIEKRPKAETVKATNRKINAPI